MLTIEMAPSAIAQWVKVTVFPGIEESVLITLSSSAEGKMVLRE